MKIYFTASYSVVDTEHNSLAEVLKALSDSGQKVIRRPFRPDETNSLNKAVGNVLDLNNLDLKENHRTLMKRIRESDVVVAEVSSPSNSIGYEIAIAQNEKKPILAVYNSKTTRRLANFFKGNDSKLFRVESYKDSKELLGKINVFTKDAKDLVDTKFILIISPEIDKYLGWAGEERRLHKAQIVRSAVEDMIAKDKEYQEFLKTLD